MQCRWENFPTYRNNENLQTPHDANLAIQHALLAHSGLPVRVLLLKLGEFLMLPQNTPSGNREPSATPHSWECLQRSRYMQIPVLPYHADSDGTLSETAADLTHVQEGSLGDERVPGLYDMIGRERQRRAQARGNNTGTPVHGSTLRDVSYAETRLWADPEAVYGATISSALTFPEASRTPADPSCAYIARTVERKQYINGIV